MVDPTIYFSNRPNGCPVLGICYSTCRRCSYLAVGQSIEMDLNHRDSIIGTVTKIQMMTSSLPYIWVFAVSDLDGKYYRSFISNVRLEITKNDIEFYIEGSMFDE